MLKNRLIPNVILNNGQVVQSVNFKHTNVIGNAITAVDFFNSWAVDEIIIIDVSRTKDYRTLFHKIINGLSKRCFIPVTVGGWIIDNEEITQFLNEGADKVLVNTAAIENPNFINQASKKFGSQCITVSIDVHKKGSDYEVFKDRGKKATGLSPVEWAKEIEKQGAGEIFLTSIDNEGTKKGFDLHLIKQVTENVTIPVIAFGGAGSWQHFVDAIKIAKADAVSAANIFHFSEHATFNAKEYMIQAKLNVRKPTFYKIPTPRRPKYNEIY